MLLTDDRASERLAIPHEPGEWMEFRSLTRAEWKRIKDLDDTALTDAATQQALVAWSYPAPITPESIGQLDMLTSNWLDLHVLRIVRGRPAAEGEAYAPASQPA